MILQTVSISAAPRELHLQLFKAHGDELEKLEKEIASLDAVALVSWARGGKDSRCGGTLGSAARN